MFSITTPSISSTFVKNSMSFDMQKLIQGMRDNGYMLDWVMSDRPVSSKGDVCVNIYYTGDDIENHEDVINLSQKDLETIVFPESILIDPASVLDWSEPMKRSVLSPFKTEYLTVTRDQKEGISVGHLLDTIYVAATKRNHPAASEIPDDIMPLGDYMIFGGIRKSNAGVYHVKCSM